MASLDSESVPYATASFHVDGITPPKIVLFKKFDEGEVAYDGKYSIETDTTGQLQVH